MAGNVGFITLHRKIADWEWYHDAPTLCLFVHLLLMANFTEGRFKGRVIKRGQLATSLRSLATHTGLSIQQTRTALEHLLSTHEITHEPTPQYSVITIVKYDEYQTPTQQPTNKQHTINTASNTQLTQDSTHDQHRYNNNNNINKETNKQGNNNTTSASRRGASDESFDEFWAEYPRKVSKPSAMKAWNKLKPDEDLTEQIMTGLEKWRNSDDWARDNGRYIPYPATWLNDRRWEDDIRPAGERKPQSATVRQVSGQQYQQRDYSGEQEYWMNRMIADIKGGSAGG